MRKTLALIAAVALACMTPIAIAQHVTANEIDPAVVHQGAEVYQNPSLDPADEIALQRLASVAQSTTYSNDQLDGGVALPWGDFLAELLQVVLLAAATLAAFLLRRLPKAVVDVIDAVSRVTLQKNASEFLELALGYGINTTADAVRGKALPIKVGSEVVERAVEYALRHAPGLVRKMGGALQLREKLIARLNLEASEQFTAARPAITEPLVEIVPATP